MFHVGDYGNCRLTIVVTEDGDAVNISAATAKQIRFERPDGTTFIKTATFTGTGSDGSIYYVFESGVLNQQGTWRCQALITFSTPGVLKSDIGDFAVGEALKE